MLGKYSYGNTRQNEQTVTEVVTVDGEKISQPEILNAIFESHYTRLLPILHHIS